MVLYALGYVVLIFFLLAGTVEDKEGKDEMLAKKKEI